MRIGDLLQNPEYKQKFVLEKFIKDMLQISREEMRMKIDQELTQPEADQILRYYNAYTVDKKPMEYILGHVDFFGIPFSVNENTLIPRPETEYMITAVTEYSQSVFSKDNTGILLDVGTGCGVLGISVLLQNPELYSQVFFSDISTGALFVAKDNYKNLIDKEYSVNFLQSDLVTYLGDYSIDLHKKITLVANLPYIPNETFDQNSPDNVQKREPRMAFVGGDDGLDYYRQMFNQLFSFHNSGKIGDIMMFLEMMTRQVDILKSEFGDKLDFSEVKTFHFNIRIVKATRKE